MTKADVFITILSEVSGRPKSEVASMLAAFRSAHPEGKWDEELSQEEAEKLLDGLRKEKAGILAWLVRGAQDFIRHNPHSGHA